MSAKKIKDFMQGYFYSRSFEAASLSNLNGILGVDNYDSFLYTPKYQTRKIEFCFDEFGLGTITINYCKNNSDIFYSTDTMYTNRISTLNPPYFRNKYTSFYYGKHNNQDDCDYQSHYDSSITIFKSLIPFSLCELINEFMSCYDREYYLACCCLTREMILEIAQFYELKLKDKSGEILFEENIKNICRAGYIEKEEKIFWINLNRKAGDVIHYHSNDRELIADEANKGIIYIFKHIESFRSKKGRTQQRKH
ncbi:MAG: hypothetical protein MJ201_01465 [Mycoplasmoidaceae bacterium]|nr:hypothetical protein [Mycoplasmoidaceae bacterium]